MSEQKGVLVTAPQVFPARPGRRGGAGGRGPGDGRGWRRCSAHRPGLGGGEEEGGVVGVLVQVGVGAPRFGRHCGGVQIRTGGQLGELILELLHLLSQTLHGVEVVGGDGMGEGLRVESSG